MGCLRAATVSIAVILFAGACGHEARAPVAPPRPAASAVEDLGDDIADPNDKCPWILEGCTPSTDDQDGCPDTSLEIADCRLSASDDSWLGDVAREITAKSDLTTVRVVSGIAACADAVREGLVKRGVPASRLETRTATGRAGDVSFEAAAWKGKRCP
jgi:hypothetical protein